CQDDAGGTYAPRIFPLLTHADQVDRGEIFVSNDDSAAELFDSCLKELTTPVATLGQNDGSLNGIGSAVFSLFSDAKCVSVPRFMLAFDSYLVPPEPQFKDKKLLSHLLKQWIQVHSFVASQGMEEARLRKVLASATSPSTAPVATNGQDPGSLDPIHLEDLLTLVSESWEPIITAFNGYFVASRSY